MKFVLTCLLVCTYSLVFSQTSLNLDSVDVDDVLEEYHSLPANQHAPTPPLIVKKFDSAEWQQIVKGANFQEATREKSKSSPFNLPINGPFFRFLIYAIVVAIIIFIVYNIIKNSSFNYKIKAVTANLDGDVAVEDIASIDYKRIIEQALATQNFRLAVRLYYLKMLNQLNERQIISWKRDKTNRDYLNEIFIKAFFYQEIRRLTIIYESAWYGEHVVRQSDFAQFKTQVDFIEQGITQMKLG